MAMKKKTIILSLIFLFILVTGFLGYWFFIKGDNNDLFDVYISQSVIPEDFDEYKVDRAKEKQEAALKLYRENREDSWTWTVIGNYFEFIHTYDKAVLAYNKVLELSDGDLSALTNLAHIYENNLEDYAKAEEYYLKAVDSPIFNYQVYLDLGLFYQFKTDKPTKAVELYLKGLERDVKQPNLLVALINFYKNNNDLKEATKYVTLLLQYYPDNSLYQQSFSVLLK